MPKRKSTTTSLCPITASALTREEADKIVASLKDRFPKGIAAPAIRALAAAGLTTLESLTKVRESDLAKLHGMGPKALGLLKKALRSAGLDFST